MKFQIVQLKLAQTSNSLEPFIFPSFQTKEAKEEQKNGTNIFKVLKCLMSISTITGNIKDESHHLPS